MASGDTLYQVRNRGPEALEEVSERHPLLAVPGRLQPLQLGEGVLAQRPERLPLDPEVGQDRRRDGQREPPREGGGRMEAPSPREGEEAQDGREARGGHGPDG